MSNIIKWQFFSYESDPMLACPCCGKEGMNDRFMIKVDAIRKMVALPFRVNSGYRCPEYNNAISSTGFAGPHTTGRALDIAADGRLKFLILREAAKIGFMRFGIGKTFIHIDDLSEDDGFSSRVIWTY